MTIHAHTDQGASCPAYINISERVANPGDVVITVRSAGENNSSSIILSRGQLRTLSNDVAKHLYASMRSELDFGDALIALKAGQCVARAGWNGKGQFVMLVQGSNQLASVHGFGFGEALGEPTFGDTMFLRTVDNRLIAWTPSQSDALAEDWLIVE